MITAEEKERRRYHRCLALIAAANAVLREAADKSGFDQMVWGGIEDARNDLIGASVHCHRRLVELGEPESEH